MLTKVAFSGIKSLVDVSIDLAPFTVLVGPNGCGKSTVLDQIETLAACTHPLTGMQSRLGQVGETLGGLDVEQLSTSGRGGAMSWSGVTAEDSRFRVDIGEATETRKHWADRARIEASFAGESGTLTVGSDNPSRGAYDALLSSFRWRAQRLRLEPSALARDVDVRIRVLEPSGFGLAAVLAGLALNDQEAYSAVQGDLRTIVPTFERLSITTRETPSGTAFTLHLVMRGAGRVPASYVSDGTLLALALLTAAHTRTLPDLLLLDDIDHGLHLSAQYTLVKAIRKVMEVRPALQVVCTTHSPYLLDAVAPEEVRVMAVDEDGRTGVRPLTAFPEYERYKPGLQTGELWAGIGEGWVMKRQAAERAGD